jgi:alkylated DNA repair dioxygenase AlkB
MFAQLVRNVISCMQNELADWEANRVGPADLDCAWFPDFFSATEADTLYRALKETTPWEQHAVRIFGKSLLAPRLSSWHGDAEADYAYSGTRHVPKVWTAALSQVAERLSTRVHRFNAVLCNYYRNGLDSMGWHSDDEHELGPKPIIASLSFGASRRFQLRRKSDRETFDITLTHGSLLLMFGKSQSHWQHALPKTTRPSMRGGDPGRINLTFRRVNWQERR